MGNQRIREGKTGNFKNSEIHLDKGCHEMMKERFTKLLLGDDMSGCGNGVSTALAISNAITNLCAMIFGHVWRLEPLSVDRKSKWRREMEWYLSVSDHILELVPCWQTFPDGSRQEVMKSRPRSDLYVNLPALRKLDNMLLGILDSFENPEFWYVDKGIINPEPKEDKWWLPVPRVPPGGLTEDARKTLQHRRDCANQILKAAMAINGSVLAEMDIPDSYFDALPIPKNVRMSLGDLIHQFITSDQFTPECLLDSLDLASDHHALEIADRVEDAIHAWRRKSSSKSSYSKSSWESFKDFVSDADKKWEQLADRAETVLLCLKRRFPGMPQTSLSRRKIQYNKDVGKSILESYSRVLESLAFNIVTRIEDLLYVDELPNKNLANRMSTSKAGMNMMMISQSSIGSIASSPYRTGAFSSPSYSPNLLLFSPAKGNRSPLKSKRTSIDYNRKGDGLRRNLFSPSPDQSSCGSKKATSRLRVNE